LENGPEYPFDKCEINLDLLDPIYRENGRRADSFRVGVCHIYKYLVELSGNKQFEIIRRIVSHERKNGEPMDVVANIAAGVTQGGKTDFQAALIYISSIGLGVVGVSLVRSAGGDESMSSIRKALLRISEKCVEHLASIYSTTNHPFRGIMSEELSTAFGIRIVNVHEKTELNLGKLHGGLIIQGRQNNTTLEKLFKHPGKPATRRTPAIMPLHESLQDYGKDLPSFGEDLLRVAIVSDEDDEVVSSAKRNKTKKETSNFEMTVRGIPENKSDEESYDDDDVDDDDEEEELSYNDVIKQRSVRASAKFCTGVSASWMPNAMLDPKAQYVFIASF
jgi:hypothetical protein